MQCLEKTSMLETMDVRSSYVAGVCNINSQEIARRRQAGHLGLGGFVLVGASLVAIDAPSYIRLVLFLPAFLAALGYLQARHKFCVGYAASGQQNATEENVTPQAIEDEGAIVKDKARARRINVQAFVIAAIATLIAVLLP